MRALLPEYDPGPLSDDDLARRYAYPARPWVRANMVSSVDGAGSVGGESAPLSGAADRRLFQLLRSLADVVVVGAGTVRAEGYRPAAGRHPALRAGLGLPPHPTLAVVSSSLDLDLEGPLFDGTGGPVVVVTAAAAAPDRRAAAAGRAEVLVCGDVGVDLAAAVDTLAARGLTRVLTEGGPRLLAQLAAAGRLDELALTVSPLLASGGAGRILAAGDALSLPLTLAGLVEDAGTLFARYVVGR